jgi:hypothetical protein
LQEPAAPVSLHAEDPLDLAQFGVGVLQLDRPSDQDLDLDAVADRHLVDEAAEVPLQLGHLGDELVATPLEVDDELLAVSGVESAVRPPRRWSSRARSPRPRLSFGARRAAASFGGFSFISKKPPVNLPFSQPAVPSSQESPFLTSDGANFTSPVGFRTSALAWVGAAAGGFKL